MDNQTTNCACFLTLDLKCCRAHLAIRRRPGPGMSWGAEDNLDIYLGAGAGARGDPDPGHGHGASAWAQSCFIPPLVNFTPRVSLLCKSFNIPQGMRSWSWMLQCDFLLTCLCVRDCRWYSAGLVTPDRLRTPGLSLVTRPSQFEDGAQHRPGPGQTESDVTTFWSVILWQVKSWWWTVFTNRTTQSINPDN